MHVFLIDNPWWHHGRRVTHTVTWYLSPMNLLNLCIKFQRLGSQWSQFVCASVFLSSSHSGDPLESTAAGSPVGGKQISPRAFLHRGLDLWLSGAPKNTVEKTKKKTELTKQTARVWSAKERAQQSSDHRALEVWFWEKEREDPVLRKSYF